ncbi:hypothetical protein RHSP_37059 [Rhizobium freirei PRF 81]|uniref:Uncharacterized protein n=1 Tax=Rhizobium freirei PRF 81 TaxID=363754 RepID=N6VEY9_9HYPH|nr:hypothetical protein RHSP_37059 [Rhizobium freirei PRF 81]
MIVAFKPFDGELARRRCGGDLDRHLAAGAAGACGAHGRRASRRTAGKRQAGAALPGAGAHKRRRKHLRQRDIGTLGKHRMVFEQRAETIEIEGHRVLVHPEDRMRIAHRGDRGRMQDGIVDRPDLQLDAAGIGKFLGQRDLVPGKDRLAHIDRNRAVFVLSRIQDAGDGLEGENLLAGFGRQRLHDAARAIAAGLRLRAIAVQNVDPGIGALHLGIVDRHDLVELGGRIDVERNRRRRRHHILAAAHVDNQDLVAKPVHPREFDRIAHGIIPIVELYMAETRGNYQWDMNNGTLRRLAGLSGSPDPSRLRPLGLHITMRRRAGLRKKLALVARRPESHLEPRGRVIASGVALPRRV